MKSQDKQKQKQQVIKRLEDAGIPVLDKKKIPRDYGRGLEYSGIVGRKREKIYIDAP